MSKKIIIRYLKYYDFTDDGFQCVFDWWDGERQWRKPVGISNPDEETIHLAFEDFIEALKLIEEVKIYNGIPLMIPNNVEGEIIEI
jgi:hypothetical protein